MLSMYVIYMSNNNLYRTLLYLYDLEVFELKILH